ncbi:hypothetical protein [Schlesneria paludicola]|uniref:hypothetical protein n=1 Tax=Schlesneria paludicola TaxID=360056 RepID=UPI00029A07E9|nr:hypothetical protein [Schlesneria paludicola]
MKSSLLDVLNSLDRRWIFLTMAIAVAAPILFQIGSDETPSPPSKRLFDYVETLPAGSHVLLAMDFDPNTSAELMPMALAFTRHCCLRQHKLYFVTLWGTGLPMIDQTIKTVIEEEFSGGDNPYRYGKNYVNLGYLAGEAVAINQLTSDIRKARSQDVRGISLDDLPIMKDVSSLKEMQLILNASGGDPGAKQWVQYAGTPLGIPLAAGCTGVQSTQLFPYYPDQMLGLVTGIRGANEYESMLAAKYPDPYAQMSKRPASLRGGPQRWAHRLMIALIVLGNGIHLANRFRRSSHA